MIWEISSRMDFTHWKESIDRELVKHQAPNKLLFVKSETGSDLIFHAVLAGSKVYSVHTHDEKIHKLSKKVPIPYVRAS